MRVACFDATLHKKPSGKNQGHRGFAFARRDNTGTQVGHVARWVKWVRSLTAISSKLSKWRWLYLNPNNFFTNYHFENLYRLKLSKLNKLSEYIQFDTSKNRDIRLILPCSHTNMQNVDDLTATRWRIEAMLS